MGRVGTKAMKIRILNLFRISCLGFSIFLFGCGPGYIIEQIKKAVDDDDSAGSLSLNPQENVYVAASFFTDPVGSIATVGLNNPHPVQKALAITDSSDVVVKSYDGKLFVINRGNVSTIQVIDPQSFAILGNYSSGESANPQDLVVANGKAFITRLDSQLDPDNKDDLWVVEPLSGKKLASLDLKSYTTDDGDRLARAAKMALAGDTLYVLCQDLSKNFEATTNGKVVVVDTKTDTILQSIPLVGRNPTDIAYHTTSNRLLITDTGVFDSSFNNDTSTPYGGIEVIDVATKLSLGILIDDANFSGYVSTLRFVSDNLGVITVNASRIASFNPTTPGVGNTNLYTSPGGFLSDLLVDQNGLLWVPERNPVNTGTFIMDPNTGAMMAGPLGVGALPTSLTLIK